MLNCTVLIISLNHLWALLILHQIRLQLFFELAFSELVIHSIMLLSRRSGRTEVLLNQFCGTALVHDELVTSEWQGRKEVRGISILFGSHRTS